MINCGINGAAYLGLIVLFDNCGQSAVTRNDSTLEIPSSAALYEFIVLTACSTNSGTALSVSD